LREEIVEVLREEGGWTKNVFSKLHLMDSFLKESQRMVPVSLINKILSFIQLIADS